MDFNFNFRFIIPSSVELKSAPDAGLPLVRIEELLSQLVTTTMNINTRLAAVETGLNEASTEITAELAKLREERLTAEGLATLDRLEAKSKALADIIPNTAPAGETPAAPAQTAPGE
jgi:DNA-binding transcriptional MerR regulator